MEEARDSIVKLLDVMRPILTALERYTWTGGTREQYWQFLQRGIIVRQHEALKAILKMVEGGVGPLAVTFLRPAFEELLWIEYLTKHEQFANQLAHLLVLFECAQNLSAQNEYLGTKRMGLIGFTQRMVKAFVAKNRKVESEIREIGRQLGWNMSRSLLPSTFYLARQVGRGRDYKFLYQGTSRFVHFSAAEIYRRVWGKSGDVTIGSSSFARYWESFALYWALHIFVDLIAHCDVIPDDPILFTEEQWVSVRDTFQATPMVPIITMEEMRAWPEPSNGASEFSKP